MTRFARMPKKRFLDPTSWEELSQQKQVEQNEFSNDEPRVANLNSKPDNKKEKKRSKTGSTENKTVDESASTPKKKKLDNSTEANIDRKKDKKKEKYHSKNTSQKGKFQKGTFKKDATLHNSEISDKVQSLSSHQEKKLEKQRQARRRRRAKMKGITSTCFRCRKIGHLAAECPQTRQEETGIGVCYKCGSSDHTTKNCDEETIAKDDNPFPFAKCFICGESGHLSRSCPDNPKGLYPKGGGCNTCGSVEHFKRDCPEAIKSKRKGGKCKIKVSSINGSKLTSADAEDYSDEEKPQHTKPYNHKKAKIVKF